MSGPFSVTAANTHSGFLPGKITAAGGTPEGRSALKPPKPPEKPLMPYLRYSRRMWENVKQQNPDCKMWDIGKILGAMWRDLPDNQKQIYADEYEVEKVEHEKAMKAYHNSPAYQAYVQNKNKGKSKSAQQEPGVYIQPVEEEDTTEPQFSIRHIACSRFQRNTRLISEVFNPQAVPDLRGVVTAQRMTVLRRQVQSLTMHQDKLEKELQGLQEKFDAKKKKIEESGLSFIEKLKEVCDQRPVIDDARFQEMVNRATEKTKAAYAAFAQRQQEVTKTNVARNADVVQQMQMRHPQPFAQMNGNACIPPPAPQQQPPIPPQAYYPPVQHTQPTTVSFAQPPQQPASQVQNAAASLLANGSASIALNSALAMPPAISLPHPIPPTAPPSQEPPMPPPSQPLATSPVQEHQIQREQEPSAAAVVSAAPTNERNEMITSSAVGGETSTVESREMTAVVEPPRPKVKAAEPDPVAEEEPPRKKARTTKTEPKKKAEVAKKEASSKGRGKNSESKRQTTKAKPVVDYSDDEDDEDSADDDDGTDESDDYDDDDEDYIE